MQNKLKPSRFGIRAKFSTTDALLYATEIIRSNINKKMVAAALLDLSNVFDLKSHETLLKKLEDYFSDCTATAPIKSYLINQAQNVILQIRHHLKVFHSAPHLDVFYSNYSRVYSNVNSRIDSTKHVKYFNEQIFSFC